MSEFVYEGTDVLENLTEAVNYNESLKNLVIKESLKGDVLDFGAGIGTFSDMVKDDLNPDCLEIDEKQANVLKGKGFEVIQSLGSKQYDYIYTLNVLEHIEDDRGKVQELVDSLKPGGKLLIFVPAFNTLYSEFDKKVGHFRRYKKEGLNSLFDGQPVTIKTLQYFDFIGFFFAFVFKVLGFKADKINKRNVVIFDRFFFPFNFLFDPLFSQVLGKNVYVVVEKQKN